ncbi:DUF481 domain-containing protein [Siansivirga zeaxanthinifaciens]|uniref:DUF481 domain-containing protein n=1 Tax=Siansivirga zeaxanthinifaciens TaxID=762954 RepID=UPI00147010A7|nr:DUF481 domain-containing protein [Siansivirga zeaxanthinifaciens]
MFFFYFISFSSCFSQAILNTESVLKEIDSTLVLNFNIEGDVKIGNVNLIQINNSLLVGKKINRNLIRAFFNYEFLSENKNTLSSDFSGQIRYNYIIKRNSIYTFIQGQNAKALNLNSRFLVGLGYRQSLLKRKKSISYLDITYGFFYEKEYYKSNQTIPIKIENIRYNVNIFNQFKLSEKFRFLSMTYFQLNSEQLKDYRFFFESRLYYDLKNISIYLKTNMRHHATPYVNVLKTDLNSLVGIEFKL